MANNITNRIFAVKKLLYLKNIDGKSFYIEILDLEWRGEKTISIHLPSGEGEEIFITGIPIESPLELNSPIDKYSDYPIIYFPNIDYFYPFQFLEQSRYRLEIHSDISLEKLEIFPSLSKNIRWELSSITPQSYRGELNFKNFVGQTRFDIYLKDGPSPSLPLSDPGNPIYRTDKPLLSFPAEVRSKKLDYYRHFREIINHLSSRFPPILFKLSAPTGLNISAVDKIKSDSSYISALYFSLKTAILRYNWPQIFRTLNLYTSDKTPVSRRKKLLTSAPPPPNPTELLLAYLSDYPMIPAPAWNLPKTTAGFVPKYYSSKSVEISLDTSLFGYIKFIWKFIRNNLVILRDIFLQYYENISEVAGWLTLWNSLPKAIRWWPGVEERELTERALFCLLQGKFKPFGEAYLLVKRGGTISLREPFSLLFAPLRDMSQLYEYWTFYTLIGILENLSQSISRSWREPNGQSFQFSGGVSNSTASTGGGLSTARGGLNYRIFRNNSSIRKFRNRVDFFVGGISISVYHQLRFSPMDPEYRSYSIEQIPDITLEFRGVNSQSFGEFQAGGVRWLFCFDAKYRAVPELRDVHSYRDSILGVKGCYLFYPGSRERFFFRGDWRELEGVGEIPLAPTERDVNNLSKFIEFLLSEFSKKVSGRQ